MHVAAWHSSLMKKYRAPYKPAAVIVLCLLQAALSRCRDALHEAEPEVIAVLPPAFVALGWSPPEEWLAEWEVQVRR